MRGLWLALLLAGLALAVHGRQLPAEEMIDNLEIDGDLVDDQAVDDSFAPLKKCTTCGQPLKVNVSQWCSKYSGWDQKCCNCIAEAESGGDAHACNQNSDGSQDVGLWQINKVNWQSCNGGKAPCDPASNLNCAESVFKAGGNTFKYWSTCRKCNCCSNPPPPPKGKCGTFADQQWNCAVPSCASKVNAGAPQPNYQCAEFVARTLASANLIPLSPTAPQQAYGNFQGYDLLWVSSKQGGPKGLEDYLQAHGWKNAGTNPGAIHECSAVMVVGSKGPWSHTAVGIGNNLLDAHNVARFHVAGSFYQINAIWNPPNWEGEAVADPEGDKLWNRAPNMTKWDEEPF